MEAIIEFKNFSFRYDSQSKPTLKNINLSIYPNEKVLILGPSGSGKSTLGKCLNGLIPNAFPGEIQGEVKINGQSLLDQSIGDLSYQVGTVLQDTSAQFVGLTVAEDVAFSLENDQVPTADIHQAVDHWLDQMRLVDIQKQSPQDLSGGQKQRVSMAGVLIDQPGILLFDEPLANLDPASGYQTMALIDQMHAELQTTIVIIEHRLEDVLSQAVDRILVIDKGEIVYDGQPNQLLRSDLLEEVGIREPLYLTAAKAAGIGVEELTDLDRIDKIQAPQMAQRLQDWNDSLDFPLAASKDKALLTLEGVSFSYPHSNRLILKDLSTTLYQGEMVSLVGTNGAGKSTLARLIAGFVPANEGKIYWRDEDISQDRIGQRARRIGYVMQDPNQMISQHLIFDEVALGLRMRGYQEADIKDRVHQVLKICGLYPFRSWPVSALSYGQKKRVSIASILILEPELLILDEPTAGQDYRHYTEFMQFIHQLNQEGLTILMITHDLQLMLEYTDRTLVMTEGQLLADTSPFDVLTSPDLTERSSLRPTSLYQLAQRMGIEAATQFVQNFIQYERKVNWHD